MIDNEMLQAMEMLLDKKLQPIKEDVAAINERTERIEERTQRLEVLLENTLPKHISIIAEQHGDIIDRLDKLADYPETRSRVSTIETVVKSHTQDLEELKKAVG